MSKTLYSVLSSCEKSRWYKLQAQKKRPSPCQERTKETCQTQQQLTLDVVLHWVATHPWLLSELSFGKLIRLRKLRPACVHSVAAKRTRRRATEVRDIQTHVPQDGAYLLHRTRCSEGFHHRHVRAHSHPNELRQRDRRICAHLLCCCNNNNNNKQIHTGKFTEPHVYGKFYFFCFKYLCG